MAINANSITNQVQVPATPNLPVAPTLYDQDYTSRFNNVLRLYFNQLDNVITANTNAIASNNVLNWLNQ
jgi:hypothetical protein